MATAANWLEGARLRTLPAAVAPVILGSGAASGLGAFSAQRALLAAIVALALQVGVNYANDYSDGIRGTDDNRTGPPRLTGGGLTAAKNVKLAAFACFGIAALAGLVLVALSGQWWLLVVGVACVIAAWYYTGGTNPYGYRGLGEVFVFIFFGLVATAGTTFTQALTVPWHVWVAACGIGLIACAILMVNNIRDIPTDSVSGKRTLAVRLGERGARVAFAAMLLGAILLALLTALHTPWALIAVVLAPAVWVIVRPVLAGERGRPLIAVLRNTGFFELAYAVLLAIAYAI
ncbi:1,4-dihydroxy-2-naphthoate polyprenyltransferase [Bowdeniella nasicola]|uniref:1,4-dihydroxy-2-naphthoate octaprenyltransferase n=1 Tax=Bowdeniella nasicola TaxID=208480 RepID=A0A1Q5Q2A7_9ACTO|nr:1,4-dihydroxy-2-naphthoate polyprenyltransferase [Bowdeniella nasicola]OKL53947.1 1,4-dihydroxy-2-naphthoate polyprenyltransferase [Bowdeniella nasicola]